MFYVFICVASVAVLRRLALGVFVLLVVCLFCVCCVCPLIRVLGVCLSRLCPIRVDCFACVACLH